MRHREPTRPIGMLTAVPQRLGALLAALMIASCGSPSPSPTSVASPSTAEPSASGIPSPSGPPTASLEDVAAFDVTVEVAPDWPALLEGSLWVLAPDGEPAAVVRLDPVSGAEQARVELPGGSCEGIAVGFGSVWACTPDGMARIDPATNTIVASVAFQTPYFFGRPAVGEDAIWAMSGEIAASAVVRIDPASNAVTATYPVAPSPTQIAFGSGFLWATSMQGGLLLRIDPASGDVTTAASDLVDPNPLATGGGRVWVGLQGRGVDEDPDPSIPDLFRFDPATGAGDFFDYGMRPQPNKSVPNLYVTDDDVWLKAEDPFLMRLDPDSGEIVWIVTSDRGSGALVVSDEALWMTLWRDNSVVRIDL